MWLVGGVFGSSRGDGKGACWRMTKFVGLAAKLKTNQRRRRCGHRFRLGKWSGVCRSLPDLKIGARMQHISANGWLIFGGNSRFRSPHFSLSSSTVCHNTACTHEPLASCGRFKRHKVLVSSCSILLTSIKMQRTLEIMSSTIYSA